MAENVIESIHKSMEEKARKSKDYHVNVWDSHIGQLYKLVSDNEGGLTWLEWQELRKKLMGYAEASWTPPKEGVE